LINTDGGKCGIQKVFVDLSVTQLEVLIYMVMISPLENARIQFLGCQYFEQLLSPLSVSGHIISIEKQNGTILSIMNVSIIFENGIVYPNIGGIYN
jgi:hypothetical protein